MIEQPEQEYEFTCECCRNSCRVIMKNAIPPDCGCLCNSDIGAIWVPRSRPAPAADALEKCPCDDCPEGVTATWVCEHNTRCCHWGKWHDAAIRKKGYNEGFDEGFEIGKSQCETHHSDMIEQGAKNERERVLKPIRNIYDRFRHLDAILSKRDSDCPMMLCYVDIWEAVKESLRREVQG